MKSSKKLLALLCVSVPSFMINLDANIVSVSLPSIARSLHADFAAIEWVISAYTLSFATLLMPAGALADRFGRKRMLLLGLTIFTLASLICGAAGSTAVLNGARALQGVGAALQLSAALATLAHAFRGAERARAFAFWGSVIGVAMMLGPVAGGLITQLLGWQWAFYVNLPVGLAMIALAWYALDESKDPHAMRVDIAGVITFSGFLGLCTLALISGNHAGWTSAAVLTELAAALVFFGLFIAVELRQRRPMVDLSFFRRPTYVGAHVAGLAYAVAFLTMLTFLPIYFQSGLGYPALKAGLLMLPMALPLVIVPRIVALYFDARLSGRTMLSAGLGLVAAGLIATSGVMTHFDYAELLPCMLVACVGAGILNGGVAKVSMMVIPPERAGMASGISGTVRFSGIVLGFAALGGVLFERVREGVAAALPQEDAAVQLALTRDIANGKLQAMPGELHAAALHDGAALLARLSFGQGYQAVVFTAGVLALLASVLVWTLIRASETAPHPLHTDAALSVPAD